ncbi:hypothetical protein Y032_0073g763 [Ancylostoma ceylanicum]|nr:hypothetical protein Y032_0073g763 [Ancylostoma ceylanicum]
MCINVIVIFLKIQSSSMSEENGTSSMSVGIQSTSAPVEAQTPAKPGKVKSTHDPVYIPEGTDEPDDIDDGTTQGHLLKPNASSNASESVMDGNSTLDTTKTHQALPELDEANITAGPTKKSSKLSRDDTFFDPNDVWNDYPSTTDDVPAASKPSAPQKKPKPKQSAKKETRSSDDRLGTWITDTIKRFSIIISVILILIAAVLTYVFYVRSRKRVEKKRQLAYEEIRRRRRIPMSNVNPDDKDKELPIFLFDTEAKGIEGETDSRPPSGQRIVEIRAHGTDFANYQK